MDMYYQLFSVLNDFSQKGKYGSEGVFTLQT